MNPFDYIKVLKTALENILPKLKYQNEIKKKQLVKLISDSGCILLEFSSTCGSGGYFFYLKFFFTFFFF